MDVRVDHLVFPRPFYLKQIQKVEENISGVKQLYAPKKLIYYSEKWMWWFPDFVIGGVVKRIASKTFLPFSEYNLVILESGKPLFLLDEIPPACTLVYRQSDSMKEYLSRNKYLWRLEEKAMERAQKVFVVREKFKEILPWEIQNKTSTIPNGFHIDFPKIKMESPFSSKTKNVIYLGYTPLDLDTTNFLCRKFPKVYFHFIGTPFSRKDLQVLKKNSNFFNYGVLRSEKYLPYLMYADVAITPFKKTVTKHIGLNSKFLLFMRLGLPIVSFFLGFMEEMEGLPVAFVQSKEEFAQALLKFLSKGEKNFYPVNFDAFSQQGRMIEYQKVLQGFF